MARPTKAEQDAKKAADAARLEQALADSARIVTPWFKREMRKARKAQKSAEYYALKERKRIDGLVDLVTQMERFYDRPRYEAEQAARKAIERASGEQMDEQDAQRQAEHLGPDTVDREAARQEMVDELEVLASEREYSEYVWRKELEEFQAQGGGYQGFQGLLSPADYKRRQWAINKYRWRLMHPDKEQAARERAREAKKAMKRFLDQQ